MIERKVQPASDFRPSRLWSRAGFLAIFFGALSALLFLTQQSYLLWPDPAISKNRAALARKLGPVRPLEGRLTGGFVHLPMAEQVMMEAGQIHGFKKPPKLTTSQMHMLPQLARDISREHKRKATSRTLGDRAVLTLLSQRWDLHQSAVSLLEEAVAEEPDNAHLLSDLAASYLASTRSAPPGDFLAISAAARAIQINPTLLEARFNLALALEQTYLFHEARTAWLDYLRLDSNSQWADEAREHLKELKKPSPRAEWMLIWKRRLQAGNQLDFPARLSQVARDDAAEEILADWALSHSQGRLAEARQHLFLAQRIGKIVNRWTTDSTIVDAVSVIANRDDRHLLELLEKGHLAYRSGVRSYRAGEIARAQSDLEVATRLLGPTGSPVTFWAYALLSEIDCLNADLRSASEIVDIVRQEANLTRFHSLDARISWVEGLIHLHRSEVLSAEHAFRAARYAALGSRDEAFSGVVDTYCAITGAILDQEPWVSWHQAVRTLPSFSNARQRVDILRHLAAVFEESHPETALYLLNEALATAKSSPDSSLQAEIWIDRSRIRDLHGDEKGARIDLGNATDLLSRIGDPVLGARLKEMAEVTRCQVLQELNPHECIRSLTGAIQYFSTYEPELVPKLYRLRASAHKRISDAVTQESDLLAGIGFYERLLSVPNVGGHRLFLLDQKADEFFDDLVSMKLHEHDWQSAFNVEERSRARPLPVQNTQPPAYGVGGGCNLRMYSPREFRHGLPKRMAVIEYQILGDRVSAWVFRSTGAKRVRLPVSRKALEHLLPAPVVVNNTYYVHPRIATGELAQLLLQPLASSLPAEGQLLFITEPILDSIDFGSLQEPTSDHPLCGDYGVAYTSKYGGFTTHGSRAQAFAVARAFFTRGASYVDHISRPLFLPAAALLQSLPPRTALIEYTFLGDRLVVWVAGDNRLRAVSLNVDRQRLTPLIDRLLLSTDLHKVIRQEVLLEELFNYLIKPILPTLPGTGSLVIVPDESLAKLPFAAFRNPQTGRYLVEDYAISMSPSATFYLEALKKSPAPDHRHWTALIVSNPSSARASHPQAALAGARREADLIAHLFPGSEIVGEPTPTPGRRLRGRHQIVHFAAHWNPIYRTYDETIEPDELPIEDSVQLVVLSACRTAFDPLRDKYDGFGLPEPMLAGGVPTVVASLWRVDDTATSRLLTNFYQHFYSGEDGAHALRAAQLAMLRDRDNSLNSPSRWAGFQLLGFGGI